MTEATSEDPCQHLQAVWARTIPLTTAMGLQVVRYRPGELQLEAALAPNVNVHGTGFAGSLYAAGALAGWGLLYLELRRRALDAAIVIARGQMDYARPVHGDFGAHATLGDEAGAFDRLQSEGRARLELSASITVEGVEKARFSGSYALRKTTDSAQ